MKFLLVFRQKRTKRTMSQVVRETDYVHFIKLLCFDIFHFYYFKMAFWIWNNGVIKVLLFPNPTCKTTKLIDLWVTFIFFSFYFFSLLFSLLLSFLLRYLSVNSNWCSNWLVDEVKNPRHNIPGLIFPDPSFTISKQMHTIQPYTILTLLCLCICCCFFWRGFPPGSFDMHLNFLQRCKSYFKTLISQTHLNILPLYSLGIACDCTYALHFNFFALQYFCDCTCHIAL